MVKKRRELIKKININLNILWHRIQFISLLNKINAI